MILNIKVTSPAYTDHNDDEQPECGFTFPAPQEYIQHIQDFTYLIFMIDNQYAHQTTCPRKLWKWEAITKLEKTTP